MGDIACWARIAEMLIQRSRPCLGLSLFEEAPGSVDHLRDGNTLGWCRPWVILFRVTAQPLRPGPPQYT